MDGLKFIWFTILCLIVITGVNSLKCPRHFWPCARKCYSSDSVVVRPSQLARRCHSLNPDAIPAVPRTPYDSWCMRKALHLANLVCGERASRIYLGVCRWINNSSLIAADGKAFEKNTKRWSIHEPDSTRYFHQYLMYEYRSNKLELVDGGVTRDLSPGMCEIASAEEVSNLGTIKKSTRCWLA